MLQNKVCADLGSTIMRKQKQDPLTLLDFGWSDHFEAAEKRLKTAGTLHADFVRARVMAVHRDALDVAGPDFAGRIHQSPLQPSQNADEENRPTTGDWLALHRTTHKILAIYPRLSLFKRRSAGTTARIQLIAANVDTVLFVTSANQDFNVARLERYLALAQEASVTPIIVITKTDLVDDPKPYIEQTRSIRGDLSVVMVDARDSDVLQQLAPWLGRGRTIALMGSSGVGKSTIVNSLMGAIVQHTQGIRDDDARGRHTTSGRSMHRLHSGAWLMDTPGMRELQIVDATSGIDAVFDDVAALTQQCRFSDCSHKNEPGCAIRPAIESGALDPARLHRFLKLRDEERQNTAQAHVAHSRRRSTGKLSRRVFANKTKMPKD